MEDVLLDFGEEQVHFVPDYFPNKTGVFDNARYASVICTLKLIQNGKVSPEYQTYLYQERQSDEDPKEILRYLFEHYEFEEYFSSTYLNIRSFTNCYVAIGEENSFEKWDRRYDYIYSCWMEEYCWRMETAIEGDDEELWTAVESDESEEETKDEVEKGGDEAEETKEEMND